MSSSIRNQIWVIADDSPSNRRRRKLAELLEGYGVRVQWSVFECQISAHQLVTLRRRLEQLINPAEDSVRLWLVPERSCAQALQLGKTAPRSAWEDRLI